MKKPLWKFTNKQGDFVSGTADTVKTLYFPLCNGSPFMSSVTPDLRGDIKTDFNSFLLEPVSRHSLRDSRISRNFWVYLNSRLIWSATGVSRGTPASGKDESFLEAGMFWQKVTRANKRVGLEARITSFVPAGGEPVEIMLVELTNISSRSLSFIPTAAIPVYARSANNLHDHRHVTSLLTRVKGSKNGITVTPTLSFNESGHKKNSTSYFVLGTDDNAKGPEYIYPSQEEFTGEGSDLEAPDAVWKKTLPDKKKFSLYGKEPMAGLRFREKLLKTKESCSFVIIMGISSAGTATPEELFSRFDTRKKVDLALESTKLFWAGRSDSITIKTADAAFDRWFRWVGVQPVLRNIFGCSFLPDFDYGKGGRGWRDLWQDCLSLILLDDPSKVRGMLINNFSGVRVDGSNATIIGQLPGEFLADRNNISRIWMDHGIWPMITTLLYVNQTADLGILLEETSYFRDHLLSRNRERDLHWREDNGRQLTAKDGTVYKGTLLEHILVENLVQFFNVGPHNHIRLENADWNDGLDMAPENGESVAFSALYAYNLENICGLLERMDGQKISVFKELSALIDISGHTATDYSLPQERISKLNAYFASVRNGIDGNKIQLDAKELIFDLRAKAASIARQIQETEWLPEDFFNGYYDNLKKPVEGKINGRIRMTLTGQVFPVMSGIASPGQITALFRSARRYLKDTKLGGFRLNTDFGEEQLSLGRAFSFSYGDKENGAFFSHMSVMFAYALYNRGFAKEGYEVISSIQRMALKTADSKIYPCLPEYFNAEGRGMYSYLSGSASWFILTYLTQIFGVKGSYGDLLIEPKLVKEQFGTGKRSIVSASFAGKRLQVAFVNPRLKDYGKYAIQKATLNGEEITFNSPSPYLRIDRTRLLRSSSSDNLVEIYLG
ncbi:MAG: cellobiose phosphorylase [Candidatus Omnitrophota bacterium]|jgi:cellobiose phosphorylase